MSDFLFSSEIKPNGFLSSRIKNIYQYNPPEITDYHGDWGSLSVSRNIYNGLQPYDTNQHLIVVIGAPVLTFCSNDFLTDDDPVAGTLSILERYKSGKIKWDEDLSGPFTILIIDKLKREILCITDMMLSIPVYQFVNNEQMALGTHVDALAQASGQQEDIDQISLTDFILNNVITFPYTTYTNIRQCPPATILSFIARAGLILKYRRLVYWEPIQTNTFDSLNDAAIKLKEAVSGYIDRVTEGMEKVALLISGGEDARAVAGMLPEHLEKDSFIFLDHMNRQGLIARKIAKAYGMKFQVVLRDSTYYLDILPAASNLIGSGQQYTHAHTIGLYKKCNLPDYPAVFGGFLAGSLLKTYDARKSNLQQKMTFLYESVTKKEGQSKPLEHECFDKQVLVLIDQRRRELISKLEKYRSDSVHEWFMNWPRTMCYANSTIAVNRRLFRSYEPFLSNEVIKIAAAIPVEWRCNRRIFHKAMKPAFKKSKKIPHNKGWFPYYSWWVNIPIRIIVGFFRRVGYKAGYIKGHQGSWGDRTYLINSEIGEKKFERYPAGNKIDFLSKNASDLERKKLTTQQKLNLLQTMYFMNNKKESS